MGGGPDVDEDRRKGLLSLLCRLIFRLFQQDFRVAEYLVDGRPQIVANTSPVFWCLRFGRVQMYGDKLQQLSGTSVNFPEVIRRDFQQLFLFQEDFAVSQDMIDGRTKFLPYFVETARALHEAGEGASMLTNWAATTRPDFGCDQ